MISLKTLPAIAAIFPFAPLEACTGAAVKSAVIKRSILLNGHKTSVSLEDEFWDGLREIAADRNVGLSALVQEIDHGRDNCNLSSALRVYVFSYFHARVSRAPVGAGVTPSAAATTRAAFAD